jgi:hypothetical protein
MTANDSPVKAKTKAPLVIGLDSSSENLVFSFFQKGAHEAAHECLRCCTVPLTDLETFAREHIRQQDVTVLEASTNSSGIAERMERIGLTAYVVNS